jgi:hypothetical protein
MKNALLLSAVTALVACATPIKQNPPHPIGVEATFIESPDVGQVVYKVTGIGADASNAKKDAMRVAINAAIEKSIANGKEERRTWNGFRNGWFAAIDAHSFAREHKFLGSRRLDEERVSYSSLVVVFLNRLQSELASKGIAASADEVADAIGNPSIVALPTKRFKKHAMADSAAARINEYLQEHDFDLKHAQGVADLNDIVGQLGEVAGHEEDEAAQIALALGAEVYVTYQATVQPGRGTVKVQASVRVYETTTGNALADATGWSHDRPEGHAQVAFDEAFSDAIKKAEDLMLRKWKGQMRKGKPFFIVWRGEFDGSAKKQIHRFMKAMGKAKRTLATGNTLHYTVRVKGDSDDTIVNLEAESEGLGCSVATQRGAMAILSCE